MTDARDSSVYLEDILDAAAKAQEFVADLSFEQFQLDERTSFAVIRALEILGEATKRVPEEVRSQAPDIAWQDMAGMRDKLIHAYTAVDLRVVWRTVHEDLPQVVASIRRLQDSL